VRGRGNLGICGVGQGGGGGFGPDDPKVSGGSGLKRRQLVCCKGGTGRGGGGAVLGLVRAFVEGGRASPRQRPRSVGCLVGEGAGCQRVLHVRKNHHAEGFVLGLACVPLQSLSPWTPPQLLLLPLLLLLL